jgi:hypothetical protein
MTSQLVEQRIRNRVIEVLEWLNKCVLLPPASGVATLIFLIDLIFYTVSWSPG